MKTKSIFLIISIVIITIIGCKKDDDPLKASGIENLGAGYDVFDNYADVEKVKAPILDIDLLDADGLLEKKTLEKSVFETSSGTSVTQYTSNLEVMAGLEGSFMFFSGAVITNFSENRYTSEEYSYATVHSSINKYLLRVDQSYSGEDLIPYLTNQAKLKINDLDYDPNTLFQVFGTHCMTGIIVGGRLDFNISAKTTDLSGSKSIGVYANASFKKAFASASVESETLSEAEWASYNNSKEEKLEIYGGASEYGQYIINDGEYTAWIESIKDHLVFCDFASSNAMIAIWDFCDSDERKTQLQDAYAVWAEERRIVSQATVKTCIVDLNVLNSGASNLPNQYNANGLVYKKMFMDLNSGAGGDYVYMYYALGNDDGSSGVAPITSVYVCNHSDNEYAHAGDATIAVDLNAGAGGDFIYLCYGRGGSNIVRGLLLFDGVNLAYSEGTSGGTNWFEVTEMSSAAMQDLNEGAGGDYVYLYFTYDLIDK